MSLKAICHLNSSKLHIIGIWLWPFTSRVSTFLLLNYVTSINFFYIFMQKFYIQSWNIVRLNFELWLTTNQLIQWLRIRNQIKCHDTFCIYHHNPNQNSFIANLFKYWCTVAVCFLIHHSPWLLTTCVLNTHTYITKNTDVYAVFHIFSLFFILFNSILFIKYQQI